MAAALEAAGARHLNDLQQLSRNMNQADTALTRKVSNIVYSNSNPACLCIMFVCPHLEPGAIAEQMPSSPRGELGVSIGGLVVSGMTQGCVIHA